ncbi:MAG: GAF domain-containing protein [Sphingobacteriaceae bacterium]|nr:GAF domain-containing protein [Sphingobacteriaceae bacterium]
MAEQIIILAKDKESKYKELVPQMKLLLSGESDLTANLANFTAAYKEVFNHLWVGFYIVKNNELVLGPFQGPIACTRIQLGRGVCGTAWKLKKTMLVRDVNTFEGHITCSALSKSEIVIPVLKNNEVVAVLDIDSEYLNAFDETDEKYLSELIKSINF